MTWQMILGLTIPSIVVLLAVFFMFRLYFQHQTQLKVFDSKKDKAQTTLPLRLHALERLILLCERMDLPDLILRLKTPGTSANALKSALIIAIQQEYEHNLTQQLYISDELWKILVAAKLKTMELISVAAIGLDENATAEMYADRLIKLASEEESLPSQIAKRAIKTESAFWL